MDKSDDIWPGLTTARSLRLQTVKVVRERGRSLTAFESIEIPPGGRSLLRLIIAAA